MKFELTMAWRFVRRAISWALTLTLQGNINGAVCAVSVGAAEPPVTQTEQASGGPIGVLSVIVVTASWAEHGKSYQFCIRVS